MTSWLFLLLAAGFEVLFAMSMKYAEGFARPLPSGLMVVAASAGIYFLTLALRELPVSVAYPIWTGIGTLGTLLLGALLLGETLTLIETPVGRTDRGRHSRAQVGPVVTADFKPGNCRTPAG